MTRKRTALAPNYGDTLALNVRELVQSGGCLLSNLAGLGQDTALRLLDGDLSEAEATLLNERIVAIIAAVEATCQDRVSPLRERIAPTRPGA